MTTLARLTSAILAIAFASHAHAADANAEPDWTMSAERMRALCESSLRDAKTRIDAIAAHPPAKSLDALLAIEFAIGDLSDALVVPQLQASLAADEAVRDTSMKCLESAASFRADLTANPAIYTIARKAQDEATVPVDRRLATLYVEAGRRAGAGLDRTAREALTARFKELDALQNAWQQALGDDKTTIAISNDEAASLPRELVADFKKTADGYVVPVIDSNIERFLKNEASGAARKRYVEAYYRRGGAANVERIGKAIALRDDIAHRLGFASWAAYQLDVKMAKKPERVASLLRDVDTALLPKAREEIAALAALKKADGDATPFAAWDYVYYDARLSRQRYAVDPEAVRAYFPVDKAVPAVFEIYQHLLGVKFAPVANARVWAPDVKEYEITDAATSKPIARFYLDIVPRAGKFLRPTGGSVRQGHRTADGGYRLPLGLIMGNGPAGAPGRPATFSHHDLLEFFHEVGHLMHGTLSTAPYATLYGTMVRGDFVEMPSQMLENWVWQPAILKRISHHVDTGEAMPDAMIAKLIEARHASEGVFWTRQAFLATYDMTLHQSGARVDPTALWFELMPKLTPLPPAADTIPDASFLPVMGGYDANYYGYLWSRVYAQDLFTAFEKDGLDNTTVGLRYRREILEPGGGAEPETLVRNFLGRPVSYEAFYRELGISR